VALRDRATSLAIEAGREVSREALAAALLSRLHQRLRDTVEGRWALVAEAWRRRAALLGELVTAQSQGLAVQGRLAAADPLRGIELELLGGERRCFRAEDTTLILPEAAAAGLEGSL
jgi:biotin-(acetyl-CoA carboxylase) ligase